MRDTVMYSTQFNATFWCCTTVRGLLILLTVGLVFSILSPFGSLGRWAGFHLVDWVASLVAVLVSMLGRGAVLLPAVLLGVAL